jgi:hypothetical protein
MQCKGIDVGIPSTGHCQVLVGILAPGLADMSQGTLHCLPCIQPPGAASPSCVKGVVQSMVAAAEVPYGCFGGHQ